MLVCLLSGLSMSIFCCPSVGIGCCWIVGHTVMRIQAGALLFHCIPHNCICPSQVPISHYRSQSSHSTNRSQFLPLYPANHWWLAWAVHRTFVCHPFCSMSLANTPDNSDVEWLSHGFTGLYLISASLACCWAGIQLLSCAPFFALNRSLLLRSTLQNQSIAFLPANPRISHPQGFIAICSSSNFPQCSHIPVFAHAPIDRLLTANLRFSGSWFFDTVPVSWHLKRTLYHRVTSELVCSLLSSCHYALNFSHLFLFVGGSICNRPSNSPPSSQLGTGTVTWGGVWHVHWLIITIVNRPLTQLEFF